MAIDPYIKSAAQEMYARLKSGNVTPYQFNQPTSRSNIWGETPKATANYGFKYYGLTPVADEGGINYVPAEDPNNSNITGPDGYAWDGGWATNVSPLTREEYGRTLALQKQTPGSFIDMLGRLIVPGTRINDQGGYYEYQPQPKKYNPSGDEELSDTPDWVWKSPTGQPQPPDMSVDQALVNTGIKNAEQWGGTIGQGGWSALKGLMSVGSAALGGMGADGIGQLGGESITIADAIKSGATASDLASMGFSAGDIALNLGGTTANSLSSATGLSPGLSSAIVKGGTGALTGSVKGGLTSGNWGGGALSGLMNSGLNSAINTGVNSLSDLNSGGGGSMDEYNFDGYEPTYDFGYGASGLDTSLGELGGLNPAGDSGGFGGWFDTADWGKIIPAAAGLGLGIYGQVSNNAAASAGQNALATASAAQQAGANNALQLQREQFEYQKRLNEPFYNKGLQGFDQYASAVTGKPGPDGKVWTPTESPAYQWQQQQMEKNTGRTLRSLGRANSTYGMNVMADQNRNLAASEYDKQLGRLADITNIARGGASSLTGASSTYGTNAATNITNSANNQANASLSGGLMNQNNIYNNQQNLMSLANLGLKAYQGGNWSTGG